MKNKWIVPAIIIAVGLFLLGQRIEQGIVRSKEAVRTVSTYETIPLYHGTRPAADRRHL